MEKSRHIYFSLGSYELGTPEEMISAYVKERLEKAKEVIGKKLVELALDNPDKHIMFNIEIENRETDNFPYSRIEHRLTLEYNFFKMLKRSAVVFGRTLAEDFGELGITPEVRPRALDMLEELCNWTNPNPTREEKEAREKKIGYKPAAP